MPTLFISYKRGTTAVAQVKKELENAHYRLWFDMDEIYLGDPDWQARIDQGLRTCDGVILCITPEACTSEPIRYEVRKAIEFGKPIFAVVLEQGVSRSEAIIALGLPPRLQVENFTDIPHWDENIARLLDSLIEQGIRVSRHEKRHEGDPNSPFYRLHQTYLHTLISHIETVDLAHIAQEQTRTIGLEEVYIDSPTHLSLSVEVWDWRVIDWWLSRTDQTAHDGPYMLGRSDMPEQNRLRPETLGFESAPFEVLVGQVEAEIQAYRAANPDAKSGEEFIWGNLWTNGIKEGVRHLHLNHLAAARNRLAILGGPGSGKSTFVRHLALSLARAGLVGNGDTLDPIWTHGALTPVYVELRRFVASDYFPQELPTAATADNLWRYIKHELGDDLKDYADDLRLDLEEGHALLILDGLDEVPYPEGKLKQRQDQLIGLARSLTSRYAHSRIIVTSRPYAYADWKLPSFIDERIAPFADSHRRTLAERLYRAIGVNEDEAMRKADGLVEQLAGIDEELQDRPLFVTLMATLYHWGAEQGLPAGRSALYHESIMLLLERWTTSKTGTPSLIEILGDNASDDLYKRLCELAYAVQNNASEGHSSTEIAEGVILKHLKPLGGRHKAVDLLGYLQANAGVLVALGHTEDSEVFQFAHRSFQEYLTAEEIVRQCNNAKNFTLLRTHITARPQLFRVPSLMAGDILNERDGNLWRLVEDVLGDREPDESLPATNPHWWAVWLAARIVTDEKRAEQTNLRKSERQIRDILVGWLVNLLGTAQVLPLVERADCGRALSDLGDPRPGVGMRRERINEREVELPDILWCDVPRPSKGTVMLGTDGQEDNPRHIHIITAAFKIAKYTITNRQYQTFAASGDYGNPAWWQGFPQASQPQALRNPTNGLGNSPRDTVSWYQAVAFTRWFTVQYRAAGLLSGGEEIRLPSEWEWEYAARGMDERAYPWGAWQEGYANTGEAGLNRTAAVGLYPQSGAWCGAQDMSGNVWEWCLNTYSKDEERRVVRGGSFYYDHGYAACTARNLSHPSLDYRGYGFRVVAALVVPSEF